MTKISVSMLASDYTRFGQDALRMKDAGVDFLGGDPVGEALKLFDDTVAQLEKALL